MDRFIILWNFLVLGHVAHVLPKETELPGVTSMMNASASTVSKISKHVAKIDSRMKDLISAQKTELASQKADFEKQLQMQADINAKLEAQNEKESTEIWELEKSNDDLRAQAEKMEKENANLRKAFTTVEARMGAVDQFTSKVLQATDDEGSAELAVFHQKEVKDAEGDYDTDSSSQDDDTASANSGDLDSASAKDGDPDEETTANSEDAQPAANSTGTENADKDASFLAISSRTMRIRDDDDDDDVSADDSQVPDESSQNATDDSAASEATPAVNKSVDMVAELKEEIAQLSEQQDNSRSQLAKLFQARFKKGADKKAQILEKQKLLASTKASLTQLHKDLQGAVKHLEGTKAKLENKLHGLGHYLAQLASFVNKPAADAEKALSSLPSDVQAFLQKA